MPRARLPKPLIAAGPNAKIMQWMNELRAVVESIVPLDESTSLLSVSTRGASRKSKGGEVSSSGNAVIWMGEWSPDKSYSIANLVRVTGGIHGGSYISNIDDNDDEPWNSSNWTQVSSLNNVIGYLA